MKTKLLIGTLVVVIIASGAVLAIKYMEQKSKKMLEANLSSEEDTIEVILEEKEEKKSKYATNDRTIAMPIDNVAAALPQAGLNDAMLVYEVYVEGGLTRFLAVFKGVNVDTIGPVRSARPVFIDYALENNSIFVHYGGSDKALEEVSKLKIDNVNGIESPENVFWRTSEKKAPHNALTSTERIMNYVNKRKYKTTDTERTLLNYVVDPVNLEGGMSAKTVNIPYSSAKVKYVYNEETEVYERYVGDKPRKDWMSGDTLTTKNIIITFANNYSTDEENGYGRQQIENIGNKDGYYITNGKAIKIKCEKKTRAGKTVYKDLEGNEIEVNDGNTYIQIVPPGTNVTME